MVSPELASRHRRQLPGGLRRIADLLHQPTIARGIAILALAYTVVYLWWRVSSTLNPQSLVFSLLFFLAELQGAVNLALYVLMAWDVRRAHRFELSPDLRADILVPTYNEDLEILEATLTGCVGVTYPHETYVLDDGRRPEVAALAARLGCRYLTRPDNLHAKAGNLNAALGKTRGDFIAILDADTVPQPDLLDRTLGYFADERVALVQLPQEFYNLDSVQHEVDPSQDNVWHEQSLFYRVIQLGKNRWNAAFWCGSPSVVRRAALEDVGGVATETVTEDIHTSLRLHARGWKTVYHDEELAFGIAPQTLVAFTVQRLRWAQGAMQLLRSRENPMFVPGLSLAQRLNYVGSVLPYFDPFPKLMLFLTPAVILTTGWLPLDVGAAAYFAHWIPFFALGALANIALGRGYFSYLAVEKYNFLKIFTFLRAMLQLARSGRLSFKVTPKRADEEIASQERRLLVPNAALVVAEIVACAFGVSNLIRGLAVRDHHDIFFAALFWALFNALLAGLILRSIARRVYRRQSYRFHVPLAARLETRDGPPQVARVSDISLAGLGLHAPTALPCGTEVRLLVNLPGGPVALRGHVVSSRGLSDGSISDRSIRLGVRLDEVTGEDRYRLVTFLYVTAPRLKYRRDAVDGRVASPPERAADARFAEEAVLRA